MILQKIKWPVMALLFICCVQKPVPLKTLCDLPEKLKEASAVEITPKSKLIWILEDSGNPSKLYALDKKGHLINTLKITNAENNDWEELSSDHQGNLYIGDFGNNHNDRKNLCIYKIDAANLNKEEAEYSQKISFYYPEQQDFPPKKSERFYDCEAFFYLKGYFYLFTKNRGDGDKTMLYQVPATEGNHAAKLLGSFVTCDSFGKCAITDADISNNGKRMVLLSNRKVWLFEHFTDNAFFGGQVRVIELGNNSELEGICFKGNSKVYLVDEKEKGTGGKLYEMGL